MNKPEFVPAPRGDYVSADHWLQQAFADYHAWAAAQNQPAAEPVDVRGMEEAAARAIYERPNFGSWTPDGPKPAWVPNGNSIMQDLARNFALAAISALRTPAREVPDADEREAQVIAAVVAWLRGEVPSGYTDPQFDIGQNLAIGVQRGDWKGPRHANAATIAQEA